MKELVYKKFLLPAVILICLTGPSAYAQKWLTQSYTEFEGLPSSIIWSIAQDQLGQIWLATRNGIAVHDGVSWKTHHPNIDPNQRGYARITVDQRGRVWAVSDTSQPGKISVLYYEGNKWRYIEDLALSLASREEITAFQVMETGSRPIVFLGTARSGLSCWQSGKWQALTEQQGLLSNHINGLVVYKKKCYAATDNGLSVIDERLHIDNRLNRGLSFPLAEIKGICLEEGKPERIWLYGQGYLGYFTGEMPTTTCFKTGIHLMQENTPVNLQPDYRHGLYISTLHDIVYFSLKTHQDKTLSMSNGLIGLGANSMLCDFEKNIWFACDRGVTRLSNRCFDSFDTRHGLLEDEVTAVIEYEPGKFILGNNYGVTYYDGLEFTRYPFFKETRPQSQVCRVLDMKADSAGTIWIAASSSGLASIDRQRRLKWYGEKDGLPNHALSLWIDKWDNIWIGTQNGLFQKDAADSRFKAIGMIPPGYIRKMYGTAEQLLYLGSRYLAVYDCTRNKLQRRRTAGDEQLQGVYAIEKRRNGQILIGSLTGLYVLSGDKLEKFRGTGFTFNQPIYFIVEDRQGWLWLGTGNGILRWDGSSTSKYSLPEGLLGLETNRAGGFMDSQGRIWVGTNRGVSIYHQVFDNFISGTPPPRLRLLHIETNDGIIPLDRPITLSPDNTQLHIYFQGISFLDEKAIRFQHKLDGFNENWSREQYHADQVVEYDNLPPGHYRFQIKAKNSLGAWSGVITSPPITVLKPYYQQWWFYLLLLLCLAAAIYGLFYLIITRRTAAQLESLVDERTRQLQVSEKRYRTLFEESLDMILIIKDNHLIDINLAGIAMLGYSTKNEALAIDIPGQFFFQAVDGDTFFKELKNQGFVKNYEIDLKRKNGEKMTVLISANTVTADMGEYGIIRSIIRDITEKKRVQEQLMKKQKIEALGTLAGGIAHDFNNILAMIIGYLELSIDTLPRESRLKTNIERAFKAGLRAKDLIKQILTFAHQSPIEHKPTDIGSVVKETLKLLRSTLPTTIDIRSRISTDSAIVLSNPTQIQQAFMNLCTNAAYGLHEKGGIMEVTLDKISFDKIDSLAHNLKPGDYVHLTVKDNGPGIDPAIIDRIFEPYFTTKKMGEGTGLGLAVTHGIVQSHDGKITVYSEPGKGAIFHVYLPLSHEYLVNQPQVSPETTPQGNDEHILLVDDEPSLIDVGQQFLEKLGYRVTTRTSSPEALEIFNSAPGQFDLVITDLTMPQMPGTILIQRLREIAPDIPIILCTGFNETITAENGKNMGIQALLIKPFTRNNLAQVVKQALTTAKKKKKDA